MATGVRDRAGKFLPSSVVANGMTRRKLGSAAAVSAIALLAATAPPSSLLPGTYHQINPVTKVQPAVSSSVVLVRGKGGVLGFSVNAIRSVDSNMGFIAGTLAPGNPVTWTHDGEAGKCRLTFKGSARGLVVTQDLDYGDCGFGYGVTASGTYVRAQEK